MSIANNDSTMIPKDMTNKGEIKMRKIWRQKTYFLPEDVDTYQYDTWLMLTVSFLNKY